MVTHGAGQEMPESLHALISAIRECYALPSGDSSAWSDYTLAALGALHGDIMADKMQAHRASVQIAERDESLALALAGKAELSRGLDVLASDQAESIMREARANSDAQRWREQSAANAVACEETAKALAEARPIVESILYDVGQLPFSVARQHPAGHSLLRTFLESGDRLADIVKDSRP